MKVYKLCIKCHRYYELDECGKWIETTGICPICLQEKLKE